MNVLIALLPTLLLLTLLQLMDSFKLVRLRAVLAAVAAGGIVAFVCAWLNDRLFEALAVNLNTFSRYVAPVTEELLKAAYVVVLLWRGRIGFLVDAAVQGFAVGTGFALIENIDYLWTLNDAPLSLWLVRGFGTAILHGATAAIFAMVSKTMLDRAEARRPLALLPGLGLAIGLHSAFNHVPLPPLAMTALLLVVVPVVLAVVFTRSEKATREWVGAGLDLDVQLLDLVRSEAFVVTRFGRYLQELRDRFGGPIVADMFCLLRLELELSIEAKAMLMAREAGLELPVTEDVDMSLRELAYLRSSIGRTGMLALRPLRVVSGRDDWHTYLHASRRA